MAPTISIWFTQQLTRRAASACFNKDYGMDPTRSYSQCGEDKVITMILFLLYQVRRPVSYFDIGSNNPIVANNTYIFYLNGGSGVLVEPNPVFAEMTRIMRPRDTFYNLGIAFDERREAIYYSYVQDPGCNTFCVEMAKKIAVEMPELTLKEKMTLPLMDINEIMEKHFSHNQLDIISIDCEGADLQVLEMIDFTRFRPKVICLEALACWNIWQDNYRKHLKENGYNQAASTFVNDIFVDMTQINNDVMLGHLATLNAALP